MRRFTVVILFILMICTAVFAEDTDVIRYIPAGEEAPALPQNDVLEVHFCKLQYADCFVLRMGSEVILIDGGGFNSKTHLLAYLRSIGVEKLDYVIATHPHSDHIGGFIGILEEIPIAAYYQPNLYEEYKNTYYTQLMALLEEKQIPILPIENEGKLYLGGATLTFYQWQNPLASVNGRSMIVHVEYGNRSVLLAADIDAGSQATLTRHYGKALRSDIIKLPHHGVGQYVEEFHAVVQPSLAIITNTKEEAQVTINTLHQRGVAWKVTALGAVVAITDGYEWQVWQVTHR